MLRVISTAKVIGVYLRLAYFSNNLYHVAHKKYM